METTVMLAVVDNSETRQELISRMENTVLKLIKQICEGTIPSLLALFVANEVIMDGNNNSKVDEMNDLEEQAIIDFVTIRGRRKMARFMTIVAQAHQLVISQKFQTKRSLYYQLKGGSAANLFEKQVQLNENISQVANLFQCTTWQLGFIAAAKGLVAGKLIVNYKNGSTINCTSPGGALIPHAEQIISINFAATSILVVEKESVFQKLLEENCPEKLQTILITGKGYPDVATRIFVKMLEEKLGLPVYIVVDANPHGFEIMCTYKYGSTSLAWEKQYLTCPTMHWLGVYPSEIMAFGLPKLALTDNDKLKLCSLEKREYISARDRQELRKMLMCGKAEIEALISNTTSSFLTSCYLAAKISQSTDSF